MGCCFLMDKNWFDNGFGFFSSEIGGKDDKNPFLGIFWTFTPLDVENIKFGWQTCAHKNLICILQLKQFFHFFTKHFFNGAVKNCFNDLQNIELGNGLLDNTIFKHIISRFEFLPKTRTHDKSRVFQIYVTYSNVEIIL